MQRRASAEPARETRTRLIAAAASIISDRGDSAATSRAITEHAGENLASVTYYFGSKKRLLAEAHAHIAGQLIQPVVETLSSDRPPLERMLTAASQLHQLLEAERGQVVGYTQALAAAARDAESGDALRDLHRQLGQVLTDDIHIQQDASALPAWVEPDAMANLIIALVNGVAVTSVVSGPEEFDAARVGIQFAALLTGARNAD